MVLLPSCPEAQCGLCVMGGRRGREVPLHTETIDVQQLGCDAEVGAYAAPVDMPCNCVFWETPDGRPRRGGERSSLEPLMLGVEENTARHGSLPACLPAFGSSIDVCIQARSAVDMGSKILKLKAHLVYISRRCAFYTSSNLHFPLPLPLRLQTLINCSPQQSSMPLMATPAISTPQA